MKFDDFDGIINFNNLKNLNLKDKRYTDLTESEQIQWLNNYNTLSELDKKCINPNFTQEQNLVLATGLLSICAIRVLQNRRYNNVILNTF
jgi:hypothetical protein